MLAKTIKGLLLVLALVVAVVALVRFNQVTPHEGPVPIVWDREVCADCKMHIGDPRFAAQIQTTEGEVLDFDDPGCLFHYMQSHDLSVRALYFRNYAVDGWLSESQVGFLPAQGSPMGYGIRAVPKDTAGAKDIDWAKHQVMERSQHPHGGS